MLPKVFNPPKDIHKKEFPKFLKILIVMVIFILVIGYLIFYSSFFKIKTVILDPSLSSDIKAITDSAIGKNIFFVNLEAIQTEIQQKYPELQNVKFSKGLPDTLRVSAEQFQGKITWQTQNHSYLVNASGIAFKEIDGPTDLPKVIDNKDLPIDSKNPVVSSNFIDFISELNNKFSSEIGFKIFSFQVNDTIFQVEGLTDQGWYVKFDTTRPADEQISQVKELLAKDKAGITQYVDVRVEGRVYYK